MPKTSLPQQIEFLNRQVRETLSPRRYMHVLGVTHTAVVLAELHKISTEEAALAGLLHDYSKEMTNEQIATEMDELGQALGEEDHPHPRTWHGLHAAAVGPKKFAIEHADVLLAVAQHTTGDAAMSPLAQVLFVADFCEPGRSIAEAAAVLQLAKRNLVAGFRRALDLKTQHMLAKPAFKLHPRTWRCMQRWLPTQAAQISGPARPKMC